METGLVRRIIRAAALLAALLGMGGCHQAEEPFRIGTNVWIGYEPLYIADESGFFPEGRPIRLVTMQNATEVQRALRAGVLEAAALTLDEALNLMQDGMDLQVVLVMDMSSGADALVAGSDIERLASLKGKRIGVESSAVGAIMLSGALETADLTVEDITLVNLTIDQQEAAFQRGLVDAVVTFEPARSRLLSEGAHVLFDSHQMPGRIVDVLVAPAAVIKRDRDVLRHVVEGHFKALDALRAKPLEVARRMAPRQAMAPEEILDAYRGILLPGLDENRRFLAGPEPELSKTARRLEALMRQNKLLVKPIEVEGLANASALP
ncbi:MAG: ABC transporter substrate-binding protein [Rhodocyclaceae bacterium]|nr:ABC transporter substrate-binding protein [Rhodocyclaceae bacterium]